MHRRFGLNALWLKLLMAVLMLLDHIYFYLPPQPAWFHQASRVVAPMFAFFVAEGLAHTGNRTRYIRRILVFGLIMLIGNQLLMAAYGAPIPNSILISLAISAMIADRVEQIRAGKSLPGNGALIALLFILCLFFEGAFLCPVMVTTFYFLREKRLLMCGAYIAVTLLLLFLIGETGAQALMVFAVVPILCYNGRRGPDNLFTKYFFYAFYPLHIWVLYLLAQYR